MTSKMIKTILFASLIVAMILPFSGMNFAVAEEVKTTLVEKIAEPTEFVGTLTSDSKQIGSFLYVKHTYTSDELNLHNVDHVYREEIIPIDKQMTQQGLAEITSAPKVTESHKMSLVHEDEVSKIDKIQRGGDTISSETYQQWKIVGIQNDDTTSTKQIVFNQPSIKLITHIEDWASKKNGSVYVSHDPINLIWTDTKSTGGDLLSKIDSRISSQGWNDWCASSDLYINISGTWTKQDEHFRDRIGFIPCNQFHVRAWEINSDLVVGSAHKETTKTVFWYNVVDIEHLSATGPSVWELDILPWGGAYHSLNGFDSAEDEAAGEFSGTCWSTSKDSHYMNNIYTRQYYKNNVLDDSAYNDGYATEILCS